MNPIKISVCIPVYGVEKYIERCARSLFEQTMTDGIEFIFVNDCTKDKSIAILERVLEEYPARKSQVKIIHHEQNSGLIAARNTGLAHAQGDYIIHCDSDDWVDLNMYKTMYNKAVETDADVVCCSHIEEYKNKKKTFSPVLANTICEYIEKNTGSNFNSLWNKLYKSKIAQDKSLCLPKHIYMGEDILRNIQMLSRCSKIAFSPEVYYHYERNETITKNILVAKKNWQQFVDVVDIIEKLDYKPFPDFTLLLKSHALFLALKTADVSAKEYYALYQSKVYRDILKLKYLPLWKKVILAISVVSHRAAQTLCLFLLKIKF